MLSRLTHNLLMRLGAEACVHIHGQAVQLRQRAHATQQQHDDAATLHRLHRARQQIGRQRLEVLSACTDDQRGPHWTLTTLTA